ncbi:MAG: hypothetical protein H6765_02035 [Candidatus Peribacteria bacterium]|nr:MAG: hypothetical protein H6765_02035 [Candidatus Peribacteria bacterium]
MNIGYDLGKWGIGGVDGSPGNDMRTAVHLYLKDTYADEYEAKRQARLEQFKHTECDLTLLSGVIQEQALDRVVAAQENIVTLDDVYQDMQLNYSIPLGLREGEVRSVAFFESYFENAGTNSSGSTGMMQVTVWPYRDMQQHPSKYDMPYIREKFREFGYDYDAVHASTKLRRQAYNNPQISALM